MSARECLEAGRQGGDYKKWGRRGRWESGPETLWLIVRTREFIVGRLGSLVKALSREMAGTG